jgi:hypothetical protein
VKSKKWKENPGEVPVASRIQLNTPNKVAARKRRVEKRTDRVSPVAVGLHHFFRFRDGHAQHFGRERHLRREMNMIASTEQQTVQGASIGAIDRSRYNLMMILLLPFPVISRSNSFPA